MGAICTPNVPLKTLMVQRGIKNKELAEVLDITPSLFSQKINENRSRFDIDEMSILCDYLNISMDDYFRVKNVLKIGRKEV